MKKFVTVGILMALVATAVGCGGNSSYPIPVLKVESLSPTLGDRQGGTPVTIKGVGFTPDTVVMLADAPLQNMVIVDENTITGTTPPAPGGTRAGVLVSNDIGLAYLLNIFYYIPPPKITGVSPNTGNPLGGITVTIGGSGFVDFGAGPNTVTIGGIPATNVVTVSDSVINCTNPPGLGPQNVEVTNANGTAVKVGGFRYFPPPKIFSVTPNAGTPLGGTVVTITGNGFTANAPGPNTVTFKGVPATNIVTVDDTTITCQTPSRDGLASVGVANSNGSDTLVDAFLFYPRPTLATCSPAEGPQLGGTAITLTGTGFVNNMAGTNTVKFGGITISNPTIVNDTTITFSSPATPAGLLSVSVSNNNGSASLTDVYKAVFSGLLAADGSKLYTVNTSTGATSAVGSIGYNVIAMATHPNGTIYGVTTTELITINPGTGAGTKVASLSTTLSVNTDLAFKGTTLYGGSYTGQTFQIDISNGSVSTKATIPYYYYGARKTGFHYDGSKFYFMTYDGSYVFFFDPDVGGYPSYNYGLSTHAVRAIGSYQGTAYGINCQAGSRGTSLSLVRFSSGFTSTSTIGSFPTGMVALTGSD